MNSGLTRTLPLAFAMALVASGCTRHEAPGVPSADSIATSSATVRLEPWEPLDETFQGCELG